MESKSLSLAVKLAEKVYIDVHTFTHTYTKYKIHNNFNTEWSE